MSGAEDNDAGGGAPRPVPVFLRVGASSEVEIGSVLVVRDIPDLLRQAAAFWELEHDRPAGAEER